MQDATANLTAEALEFVSAVQSGRLDRADALLPQLTGRQSLAVMRQITDLHIRRSRWTEAAEAADACGVDDAGAGLKRNFARNFACLRTHRPDVYRALTTAPPSDRYTIIPGADGAPTLARRKLDNTLESLSQNNMPLAVLAASMKSLEPTRAYRACFAICSIGDGYLPKSLAADPPKLLLGAEQGVYIIEPDVALLSAALLIHDYSGPTGPIEQPRFEWFIGRDWKNQFRDAVFSDPSHLYPTHTIGAPHLTAMVETELGDIFRELAAVDVRLAQQIEAHYANVDAARLVRFFGEQPPRPPRVLLLTTRFSTVLQYSTRDAAEGFRDLGWDARVLIEPAAHHGLTPALVRRAVAEFKPDAVFQLDHLRHEHGNMFPPQLPFICWIQDHLSNLMDKSAGAAITRRDFVLGANNTMYRDRYGYPTRQLLDMPKLTHIPSRPANWESDGDDLTYVSNASQTPQACLALILQPFPEKSPARTILSHVGQRMFDLYAAGQCLFGPFDVRRLLLDSAKALSMEVHPGPALDASVSALFDRLNNMLFRQQALTWVADLADEMGLKLSIYGNGWHAHPRFAKYARGTIEYGQSLEHHTRATKINLQIVPSFCLHQRFLDGLVAGGFFLIRDHPANFGMVDLCNFLTTEARGAETAAQVRTTLRGDRLEAFEQIMMRNEGVSEVGDPVELALGCVRSRIIVPPQSQAVPRLDEITFSSPADLRDRLKRFLSDGELRKTIATEQRQNVEDRLSYAAGIGRMLARVRDLLASEPAAIEKAA